MDVNAKTAPSSRSLKRRASERPAAVAAEGSAARRAVKLARKHLEAYVSLVPRLLVNGNADTVHDFRVSSRRLEQILRLLWPKPRGGKRRRLLRSLGRRRRALSACRSLDVTARLLQDDDTAEAARAALNAVRERALALRKKELNGALKRLERLDIAGFIAQSRQCLKKSAGVGIDEGKVHLNVDTAGAKWLALLEQAKSSPNTEHLHELRLAGKRLRYRLELLARLGDGAAEADSRSLKILQDKLGDWHDRQVAAQFIRQCLARPTFLKTRPDLRRFLEAEVERRERENAASMRGLLRDADKVRSELAHSAEENMKDT